MNLRTTLSIIFPRITEAFDKMQREWITSFIRVLEDTLRNIRLDLGDMDFSADITTLQGDVIDIEASIEALEARTNVQVRQTVNASEMDSDGKPNFLSINGNNVDLLAADSPLVMSFAGGFNGNGALDYIKRITADVPSAFSGFQGLAPNYLYALLGDDGEVTYGHTPYQPQYGRVFDKSRYSLLHFEGADGSTDIIDEWGNTWTAAGNAHIEQDDKKFGSTSLYLDGTGDYIARTGKALGHVFSLDFWIKPTNVSAPKTYLMSTPDSYGIWLVHAATSGKLGLYLSDNSASWNIAYAVTSTNGVTPGGWNHIAITHDGSYFRVYLNGAKEIEVATGTRLNQVGPESTIGFRIGASYDGSLGVLGYIDEVRYVEDAVLFGPNFSVPTSPYAKPDVPFFSIPEMKMNKGTNDGMAAWRALFLGEAITDSSGTPTSVINYTLNGKAISGEYFMTTNTDLIYSDNLGCDLKEISIFTRQADNYAWSRVEKWYANNYAGYSPVIVNRNSTRLSMALSGNYAGHRTHQGEESFRNLYISYGKAKVHVSRLF